MTDSIEPRRAAIRPPGAASALAVAVLAGALAGCASGPREEDLLPDEGPTTLEVYERHLSGQLAGGEARGAHPAPPDDSGAPGRPDRADGGDRPDPAERPERAGRGDRLEGADRPDRAVRAIPAAWVGEPVAPAADADSRRGAGALADLQQDFRRVPNPEILGYVYPHLSGDLPVPGYYTTFPLREGVRYARPGEGDYPGVGP